jgi:hypothetical protein
LSAKQPQWSVSTRRPKNDDWSMTVAVGAECSIESTFTSTQIIIGTSRAFMQASRQNKIESAVSRIHVEKIDLQLSVCSDQHLLSSMDSLRSTGCNIMATTFFTHPEIRSLCCCRGSLQLPREKRRYAGLADREFRIETQQ